MQAGELGEGEEESGIAFEVGEQPSIVAEPDDGPLDFPTLGIAFQHAAVLSSMPLSAAFAMRADQLHAVPGESITERIAVRGAVVNQSQGVVVQDTMVEQRFDQSHFGGASTHASAWRPPDGNAP